MEDMDQSPLVSSSSDSPPRPQPPFKYQFVREPEDEEEDDEEDEEDEDEDLEVLERKPAAGLSAAPVPTAPAAGAPLLDFGSDFVPPAPRGPLPAAPPAAPERPPSWDPSPVSPSVPAPSLPSAAAASPSKLPEEDEPPARPPPPPPASVTSQAEPAWTPPAPAPAAPSSTPAAPKRRGSSGSVDETLFALPAASEPVIHSSAEKIMDLKEQPGNTVSTGQEDFPSVLLETAASLPSLSPLSAASFKEHEYLGNLPAVLPTEGTLQETSAEASKEFTEKAKNPFVDRDLTEFSQLEYSEMRGSFSGSPKAESAIIASPREENKDEKEDLVSNNILRNQQELPAALTKSVKEEDKVMLAEKTKDSFNEKGIAAEAPMREEYADFKPFERVWDVRDRSKQDSDMLAAEVKIESKLESKVDKKCFADSLEPPNHEKDSESSNDDTSFPSTPEAVKDGSGAYITCAPFNPTATENLSTNVFPLLEDQTSENKTDEKKIEEKKAQIVTEKNISTKTSNPFLVATQDSETDYVTTDNLSKVTEEAVANVAEGLTPDLVQEACESELNEATGTKLAFETKMDLVQTSEAMQESLYPVAQLCPSFEESEATPSPVLPDIVMEAPLNSVVPSAGASAAQPSSSQLEAPSSVNYESMKPELENPPPYEDTMNVSLKKVSGIKEEIKEPESIKVAVQETEAPYISIACDLIKETKLPTEPTSDFSDYSEIAKVAEPVPDHSELVEDSSPDSEPVDLFSDDSIPDIPQKQDEAVILVRENLIETSSQSMIEPENKEKLSASLPPEGGKPYLESFQPSLDTTKDIFLPNEVSALTQKEKIPLQVKELSTAVYSDDGLFVAKEAKIRESETFSDSSPIEIIDEFPTFVSSKTDSSPKLTREYTDLEVSHKSKIANVQDETGSLPCSELPHDLSFKSVQPKDEDKVHVSDELSKDRSDISKVPLLPPDVSALATQTEIGSIVKPKVLVKEAEKKTPSDTEQENRSPSAIFSAELSKTSVVDLLYWRDIKKTGVVFGASLFLLLSLTVFSIVSVTAYIVLALLSVTISFRIYKGVIQAIQKSDEGHPFRAYLESEVAISEELVQKYSNSALGHVNCTIKELRRLFLVDDLVDSLKFAVLMWVFTYVGALFNGLTLLILALISLFSVPVIYERHQAQIDHYLGLANKNVKDAMAKIQAKIPGLKRKAE
ncbi:reticulon-4 isoform X1 [Hyaena hyaena]|uniref:reticulon-4 isoform X1 n=1 Tax=Hyaena hyaena TaxID=95912 RepID=UPI00192404DD|nr:reticulon-4 isoform X1 [Hyaena hyaena]